MTTRARPMTTMMMLALSLLTLNVAVVHSAPLPSARHVSAADLAAIIGTDRQLRSLDNGADTHSLQDGGGTRAVPREVNPEERLVERAVDDGSNLRFAVLLDAGSSSTKVKVYNYSLGVAPSLVPRVQQEDLNVGLKPGLGDYVSRLGELLGYISEALGHAINRVPSTLHASTPVFLMATAGLRTLPEWEAKELLEAVRQVMDDTTVNPFLFHHNHVSILAGEEEAAYAWVAVNYLRGFFSTSMTREESVGVMEMGGGSMQVAFLPDDPLYQEEFQVYVGRHRFDLYAQSYLSFGSNYISGQIRRALLQDSDQYLHDNTLDSPCMLRGDVVDNYVTALGNLTIRGTGNAELCEQVLDQVLQPAESDLCSPSPCAIGDTYQPPVGSLPFYAFSAFLYAPKLLGAREAGDVLNIEKLRRKAWEYCKLTVSEAVEQTGTKAKFASNDCMMGLYIPQLLTTAMGFDMDTRTITVTNSIQDTHIDWALGAVVQQLSMRFLDNADSCHDASG